MLFDEELAMSMRSRDLRDRPRVGPGGVEPPTSRLSGGTETSQRCSLTNIVERHPPTRKFLRTRRFGRFRRPLAAANPVTVDTSKATAHAVAFFAETSNMLQHRSSANGARTSQILDRIRRSVTALLCRLRPRANNHVTELALADRVDLLVVLDAVLTGPRVWE